jgi:flagellar hook protein FlgE
MASSLFTALSSLQAHQGWIDVIGNNLANASTPGFKSSRASFANLFTQNLRPATAATGNLGGRNPVQIGAGVSLAAITRNFDQGSLAETGRTFDMSIRGQGFFVLNNGQGNVYTRVGTFGLDGGKNLVDLRTGFRVVGANGAPVNLDLDGIFPPRATTALELSGNLPREVGGPLAEILTGASGLVHGSPAQLTGNQAGPFTLPAGETFSMTLTPNGGAPLAVSILGTGAAVTSADIAAAIDALEGLSATVDPNGFLQVATERTGAAVTLRIQAGPVGNDLASLAGLSTALVSGSEAPAGPTTTLNDLPGNVVKYQLGDVIEISGVDTDGAPVNASFVYGVDGTTVDSFVAFLGGLYTDAQVSIDAQGRLLLEAGTPGEASLALTLSDGSGQAGRTDWPAYSLSVTTNGTGPDRVVTSTEVYDSAGVARQLTLTYERQADGSWSILPALDPAAGQVLSGPITGLRFDDQGRPTGLGAVASSVLVRFAGQSGSQQLKLDLGSDGQFDGLTQLGGQASAYVAAQNGFGSGDLANVSVGLDGEINGIYSNGQMRSLGSVGVANFSNPGGLRDAGNNLWAHSANSGDPVLGRAGAGGAGDVIGGAIENSNVDTASQFVHLIEAQRGYQASARIISVQNDILAETLNLIR